MNSYRVNQKSSACSSSKFISQNSFSQLNHSDNKDNQRGSNFQNLSNGRSVFINDKQANSILRRVDETNLVTIKSSYPPEFYLEVVRRFFINQKNKDQTLSLQGLGNSTQNLLYLSSLLVLSGLTQIIKIKNNHLTVPVTESNTGKLLGLMKRVRLTIKVKKSDSFEQIESTVDQESRLPFQDFSRPFSKEQQTKIKLAAFEEEEDLVSDVPRIEECDELISDQDDLNLKMTKEEFKKEFEDQAEFFKMEENSDANFQVDFDDYYQMKQQELEMDLIIQEQNLRKIRDGDLNGIYKFHDSPETDNPNEEMERQLRFMQLNPVPDFTI